MKLDIRINRHLGANLALVALLAFTSPISSAQDESFDGCGELFNVGNKAGCNYTDFSNFSLSQPAEINRLIIWYNASIAGTDVVGELRGPGVYMKLRFNTVGCDVYQSQWCSGHAVIHKTLRAGDYQVTIPQRAICQNAMSGGKGFIIIKGCIR